MKLTELSLFDDLINDTSSEQKQGAIYKEFNNKVLLHDKLMEIWTKINLGTMREVDCFVTDYNFELVTDIEKTLIEFQLDDVGNVGMIESDVDVSGSDLATELSK